jgi:glycosyltransferase involved in cell wall biosynthesis
MNALNMNLSGKKVAIVTHRSIMPCIPGDDLKKFLLARGCSKLLYITHPLLLLKESQSLSSQQEYFTQSKRVKFSKAYHWKAPEPFLLIKDFLYTLYWTIASKEIYDVFFGINNLNALAGLFLKKIGRVRKVVYYTIDLYPQRFENQLMNWIYHTIDGLCVKFCDETWNVSPYLVTYREKRGLIGKNYLRQFTVPIGVWFEEIERVPWEKIKKTKIVYVGHLKNFFGVDLIIRSLPLLYKRIPKIHLEIIGGGEQLEELKQLAHRLGVFKLVSFCGWKEKKEAENLCKDASLGLAPFNTQIIDEKIKNADPAKIKDYLAQGLPVIMTNATLNASAIEKANCGIIIDFTPKSLADAVTKLLSDEKLLKKYRENALEFAKQFDWNNLFTQNVSRLL